MSHTIRPFTEADTSAVVDLWKLCDLTRPWNDPTKDITRKLTVQPELFLLAEQEGRIIGSVMAGYEGHRGWINYLAVHPDHRRAGLGRQLMAAAEKRLLSLGCPKINLQVRTSNAAAIGFYQSIGFAQDEVASYGKRLISD